MRFTRSKAIVEMRRFYGNKLTDKYLALGEKCRAIHKAEVKKGNFPYTLKPNKYTYIHNDKKPFSEIKQMVIDLRQMEYDRTGNKTFNAEVADVVRYLISNGIPVRLANVRKEMLKRRPALCAILALFVNNKLHCRLMIAVQNYERTHGSVYVYTNSGGGEVWY